MSTETQQKTGAPQIVRIAKAFTLAEYWVNNMSKSIEDEAAETEPQSRPERLGLGAKVVRQSKVGPWNDPVERKLRAKLESGKRKAAKHEDSIASSRDGNVDSDDNSDSELESRTSAFAKKRGPPAPLLQVKKKSK